MLMLAIKWLIVNFDKCVSLRTFVIYISMVKCTIYDYMYVISINIFAEQRWINISELNMSICVYAIRFMLVWEHFTVP